MRLADFIESELPAILAAWDVFARKQLPAAGGMDALALRDHAEQILRTIAADLRTVQSSSERQARSQRQVPHDTKAPDTAAQSHALLRAAAGFTLQQMVSEYRALRTSVLGLWLETQPEPAHLVTDLGRFNEGIDQAVAESVNHFAHETERWRHAFVGMLGHDLRNPLNVILLTAHLLSKQADGTPAAAAAMRLLRSGRRMQEMLDDLLDFGRTSMGVGIRITPRPADLGLVCAEEVEVLRAAHPDNHFLLTVEGPTSCVIDRSRIMQLIGNLGTNAVKHGDPAGTVDLLVTGSADGQRLTVGNAGTAIPPSLLAHLFDPLGRGGAAPDGLSRGNMGLGLFIVKQIALSHGGDVTVQSAERRTVFTVALPAVPP